MQRLKIISFAILFLSAPFAMAQGENLPRWKYAQQLLDGFLNSKAVSGYHVLDEAAAVGLRPSLENVQKLTSVINSSRDFQQQSAAVRLIGDQFRASVDSQIREAARSALRNVFYGKQSNPVRKAAILEYSRLNFCDDTLNILHAAHTEKLITDEDYYGDLAHLTAVAPARDKQQIYKTILQSGNVFASEILSSYIISNPSIVTSDNLSVLVDIVEKSRSDFDRKSSAVGATQLISYSRWLMASAILNQRSTGISPDRFIFKHLTRANVDPREIIAYAMESTDQRAELLKSSASADQLRSILIQKGTKFGNNEFYKEALARLK